MASGQYGPPPYHSGWAALQAAPFTPAAWRHPLWESAGAALGAEVSGAISLDAFRTGSSLVPLLTYAGIFWLGLQYCRDPGRARRAFLVLTLAGLVYAAYGLVIQFSGANMVLWLPKAAHRDTVTSKFINRFSALEDPRQAWKVLHPLPEIMLLVLSATLAGADGFVEIADPTAGHTLGHP